MKQKTYNNLTINRGGGILNKKTNIQELYENLVQNHKKIILFGIGKGVQDCMKK